MATRRFRIKAIANVSVSRGRCVEKPHENEKLDEKTSKNSSTASDSHEVSPSETKRSEIVSDITFIGKVSDDSSSKETLQNTLHDLVQKSETVSELTCLEANGSDRSTPVDSLSVVKCNIEQYTGSSVQQSDDFIANESRLCDTTEEGITRPTSEHCLKTEEIVESLKSGVSCVTSPQKIDTTENKIAYAPIRLSRKRVKPTVSLVNRKAKENSTIPITQQCNSLDKTLGNSVTYPLFQNSGNVSGPTNLEANDSEHSTSVDTASVIDHHLPQDPPDADVQQSGDCDTKDVSLCNKTDENITGSTNELPSTAEVGVNFTRLEDSCVPSGQTVDTTGTKISAATIRLPRKRVKPAVSLSVINKKVKENLTIENTPVCHSVQNSANVCEPVCLEETDRGCSTPVDVTNVVSCNLTQDRGYGNIQHSVNCDSKDVSICHRTDENITVSSGEHCSKNKETINSSTSEDSFATSAQVIDTLGTEIPAAPIRLPRKRVKPSVSLSVINKVKENIKLENTPVSYSVQNPENISEPTCLEETDSARSSPIAACIITCNLTQNPGCDNIQQTGNCDSKDVTICNRPNEEITESSGDYCSKPEESIAFVSSEDSFATCAQKSDTLETNIPAAPLRLPRKRVKPAVSLSLVNKKAKENLTVENKPVCYSAQSSPKGSEPNCMEENDSDNFTAVGATNEVTYNLTQDTGYVDIQQSDNCHSKHESICNRINEDIKDTSGEHCSKTEESIDSVSSEDSFASCAQKIDTLETNIPAAPIRLPRKRVKPAVSLSLVNKKVKENLTVENKLVCHSVQNPPKVSEPTCLEENNGDHSTSVDVTDEVVCNSSQDTGYANVQQPGKCASQDVSISNRTNEDITASSGEQCCKTEDSIDSVRSDDLCASSAQKIDTTEIKLSAAPIKLPRKRMKPTVSLSSVNKKVKENCAVQLTQNHSASRIDDCSTVEIRKKLETSSSELHKDVEADGSVRTIPVVGSETPSSVELREVEKSNDNGIVPQTSVETSVLQTVVCEPERRNDISVDAPVGEPITCTVSVSPPTCDSSVMNDSPVVGKDERTSPPVKCSVNQLVKDCSPLNSFRSRFVRPKPLLESAARRNRTGSIGSASESDSEKKSLSSATTVSPPWKPKLKTYRNRLTHLQALESDKLANASSASTDESEDERSTISRAATISPPKKITRLDSGSDTSHSEFSQEVSDENSSPVKKSKPEVISKRREYLRRIIEIKKEISHKVSDGRVNKSRLTMFDLIYYNPVTNPMKSVQESSGVKSGPSPPTAPENEKRLAEESVDEPEALEDEEQNSTVPVPQVKVGPNGEIILDEQSLVIETTDAKKNWNDLQNSEVIMDYGNGSSRYNAYSKKRRTRTKDWNREETLRFYRALHTVGTDFLVMQSLFPKFTRKELKDRYKKEERINRELVEKALRNPLTFDLTELRKEFEQERLEEERRLAEPKKRGMTKRKGGYSRSCSLFATLDSTDKGNKEKPVKRKREELKDITHSQKKRKTDDITTGTESKPKREETNSKNKRKTVDTRTTPECTADREETDSKKKRKVGDTRTPSEDAADRKETHSKKKRKTGDMKTPPECTNDSEATHGKKKRKADDARTPSESAPESDTNNAMNGHVDMENIVPEAVSQVKPTRSGRIPRPRIFEDFTTDDVEEVYEETEITEICERVTVEDVCNSEPLGDESVEPENVVVDEDSVATYESENEDQNFVIAEDALTVQQSQVNLGSVYSNVKPGTLIVLATESPDNPGHQIFRVFMVSNNSQTMPVSVANNQALPTGTNNSVEMNPATNPIVSESSTNDCNSLQMSAESSS